MILHFTQMKMGGTAGENCCIIRAQALLNIHWMMGGHGAVLAGVLVKELRVGTENIDSSNQRRADPKEGLLYCGTPNGDWWE